MIVSISPKKYWGTQAVMPDTDKTFNFLVSILYIQLFQQLFAQADASKGGRLPVPVHTINVLTHYSGGEYNK